MRDKLSTKIIAIKRGDTRVFKTLHPPIPKPGPGEIQIKMEAAGVAFADIMLREGIYPLPKDIGWPRTPGYDVVGKIEAVGAGVPEHFTPGTRVASLTVYGSYARHRLLPAEQCVVVPESVDATKAVALILNYLTAWQMLHRVAKVQAGDTILIHAAAGGVGTALLELAAMHGVNAIGYASKSKHAIVTERGGHPLDYRNEDIEQSVDTFTQGKGLNAVFDAIGGKETSRALSMIKPSGVVVCYGVLSITKNGRLNMLSVLKSLLHNLSASPLKLLSASKGVVGYNVDTWRTERPAFYREDLETLLSLLAENKIDPLIGERISLEEAARAQQQLASGASTGKLVLI